MVELAFAKRAGLFNASLDGNVRRAIDIPEGAGVGAEAFEALALAAALNAQKPAKRRKA